MIIELTAAKASAIEGASNVIKMKSMGLKPIQPVESYSRFSLNTTKIALYCANHNFTTTAPNN
jgi:hypothetical protein